ncbi:hypothetical protein TPA0906_43650 [Streptomyces olivaceus]|nr:hypothetical protein TPA0906_43650 [Streptomyces olivaceus]
MPVLLEGRAVRRPLRDAGNCATNRPPPRSRPRTGNPPLHPARAPYIRLRPGYIRLGPAASGSGPLHPAQARLHPARARCIRLRPGYIRLRPAAANSTSRIASRSPT